MLKVESVFAVMHVGDVSFYVIDEIQEGKIFLAVPQSTENLTETASGWQRVFAPARRVAVYGTFVVEYLTRPYPILCTDGITAAEAAAE